MISIQGEFYYKTEFKITEVREVATKIAIIGAGSGMFSLSMIKDICLTPGLNGSTVTFMDIDERKLHIVYDMCTRYARELKANLTLEQTTDRETALKGSDFVINTAAAESHEHWREGWQIAMNLGYRFGGSFHIVHDEAFWINFYQLRLMEAILQDMERICPTAWYVGVANPVMAATTYLPRKYPNVKVVGLCHGYRGVYGIADLLGMKHDEITFEIPGVNHFVWMTHFRYRGKDAFPLLDEWIKKHAEDYWKNIPLSDHMGPKPIDLYRRFGVFPIGDTANPGGGAWGYWYHTDDEVQKRWQEDPVDWFDRYFEEAVDTVETIRRASDPSSDLFSIVPPEPSGETIIPLIDSIANDIPRVLIVNTPNRGSYVPGIPQDFAVEIPALVSARGIEGIQTNPLPKTILAHALHDRVAPVETELEAYENGDYESLLQLILMDPWTRSEAQARALIDNVLNLPYHTEMKDHYRRRSN